MKRLACCGCFAGAWWDLQQMSWLLGNANEKQIFKTLALCGPESYLPSLLHPSHPPAPCSLPNIYKILTRNKKARCGAGFLTARPSQAAWETHTCTCIHTCTHTCTHMTADFLCLLIKEEVIENKTTNLKIRIKMKWAVAPNPALSLILEFSQSLGLACVCMCMLGVGMCLFSISPHAFSSWALALPLLPSCCKLPFPFKAFRHNELIFPCSRWKTGYVHESCSLRGPF